MCVCVCVCFILLSVSQIACPFNCLFPLLPHKSAIVNWKVLSHQNFFRHFRLFVYPSVDNRAVSDCWSSSVQCRYWVQCRYCLSVCVSLEHNLCHGIGRVKAKVNYYAIKVFIIFSSKTMLRTVNHLELKCPCIYFLNVQSTHSQAFLKGSFKSFTQLNFNVSQCFVLWTFSGSNNSRKRKWQRQFRVCSDCGEAIKRSFLLMTA